jgi:hypothetical protein
VPTPRREVSGDRPAPRRRWRDYRTTSGRSPVEEFIDSLPDMDASAVLAGMAEVRDRGLAAARHLEGDIWEVRVDGDRVIYHVLFATLSSRSVGSAIGGGAVRRSEQLKVDAHQADSWC